MDNTTTTDIKNQSWREVRTAEEACEFIDVGLLLTWKDMKIVKIALSEDDQLKVINHIAARFAERVDMRLSGEILIETLLIWLAQTSNERLIYGFIEQILQEPAAEDACWSLVEVALTTELVNHTHLEEIFAMGVALVCQLGIYMQEFNRQFPGEFKKIEALFNHIATFLLSLSNSNHNGIRLSLLHYFGYTERHLVTKNYFNRLMTRFGYTILEQLFGLLFQKKTEAIALEYILENLPYVLEADATSQHMVHETFRYYLLKEPERFALFVQIFTDHILQDDGVSPAARKAFLKHLAAILHIVSYVNHKQLGREIMINMAKFEKNGNKEEIINEILREPEIRKTFRDLLSQFRNSTDAPQHTIYDSTLQFKCSKRGRKPCFSRVDADFGTIQQIMLLGQVETIKAS